MERIKLYAKNIHTGCDKVVMECHLPPKNPDNPETETPAVIIFPGGGYAFCSEREATPVANVFLAQGYAAFVVRYTLAPECEVYNPLLDAAMAVHTVRTNADEFGVDPNKIAVCGFSAGGHLAAHISTSWNSDIISDRLDITNISARPNATILGYPVISGVDHPNMSSFQKLTGSENPSIELLESLSADRLVDNLTCPAFVWHTSTDTLVPVRNSLLYCNALAEHDILFELHVFPFGGHGYALANRLTCPGYDSPYITRWVDLCCKWCDNLFYNGNFLK